MRGGCIGVLFIYLWAVTLAQKTLSSLSGIIKDISKNQSHILLSASLLKKEDELIALWDPGLRPCDSEDDKENVLESLSQNPRFIVTPISQKQHEECHHINARYSGTDLKGGILEEDNALNASDCQSRCKMNSKCKYFLFFSKNHHQRFKHGICRLLQYSGKLEKDLPGHISGPKACLSPEVKNQINYICLKLKELLSLEATYESSQKLSCSPSQLNKDIKLLIPRIEQSVSYLFVEVILSRYCDTSEGSSEIQIVRDGKLLQKDYFENETASVLKDDSLLKSDNVNDIISTLTLDSQKKVESNTKSLVTSTDAATTQNQIQISTEPLEKDISSREQMKNSEISKGISEISTGPILSPKVERKLNDNDENPLDSGTTSKILDVKLEKAENAPLYDDYLYYDYYENDAIESSLTPENLDSTPPNVNLVDKETINQIIKETKATSNPSFPESKNQVTTTSGFINDFNLVPVTSTEATTKKIATTEPILKEKEINFNTVSSKISESEIERSTIRSLLKEFNGFNLESVTKAEAPAKKFEMAKLIPRKAGINLNTVSSKTESDTERSTTQFLFKEFNGFNLESVTKAEDPTKKNEMTESIPKETEINLNTVSSITESDAERSTIQFLFKESNGFNLESVTKEEASTKKVEIMESIIPKEAEINLNTLSTITESDTEKSTTQSFLKEFNGFILESVTRNDVFAKDSETTELPLKETDVNFNSILSSSVSWTDATSTTFSSRKEFIPLDTTMRTFKETSLSDEDMDDYNKIIESIPEEPQLSMNPNSPSFEFKPDISTTVSPVIEMNMQNTESTPKEIILNLNPTSPLKELDESTTIPSINNPNYFNIQSLTRVGDLSNLKKGDRVKLRNDRNDLRPTSSSGLSNINKNKSSTNLSSINGLVVTTDSFKNKDQRMKIDTENDSRQMTDRLGNKDADHSSSTSIPSMVIELTEGVNQTTDTLNSADLVSDFQTMNQVRLLPLLNPPTTEKIPVDSGNMGNSKSSLTTSPSILTLDNQKKQALTQLGATGETNLVPGDLSSPTTISYDKIIFPSTEFIKSSTSSDHSNKPLKIVALRNKDLPLFLRVLKNHFDSNDVKEGTIPKGARQDIVRTSATPFKKSLDLQTTIQPLKKKIYIYPKIIQLYPNRKYGSKALWLRFYSRST